MSLKVHVDRDRGSRTVSDKDKSKHSSSRYPVDLRSMLSSKDRRDRDRHESRDHREERRRDRRHSSSGGGDLRDRLDRYKDSDYRDHRDQHCEMSSGKSKLLSMFLEDKNNPEKDFKGKENGDLELQLESNRKAQKDLEKKLSNEWSERKKKKKKRSKSRSRDKDRKPLVNKESENRKRKLSPSVKTEKETSDESKPKKDKSRSKSRGEKDAKKKKKEKKSRNKSASKERRSPSKTSSGSRKSRIDSGISVSTNFSKESLSISPRDDRIPSPIKESNESKPSSPKKENEKSPQKSPKKEDANLDESKKTNSPSPSPPRRVLEVAGDDENNEDVKEGEAKEANDDPKNPYSVYEHKHGVKVESKSHKRSRSRGRRSRSREKRSRSRERRPRSGDRHRRSRDKDLKDEIDDMRRERRRRDHYHHDRYGRRSYHRHSSRYSPPHHSRRSRSPRSDPASWEDKVNSFLANTIPAPTSSLVEITKSEILPTDFDPSKPPPGMAVIPPDYAIPATEYAAEEVEVAADTSLPSVPGQPIRMLTDVQTGQLIPQPSNRPPPVTPVMSTPPPVATPVTSLPPPDYQQTVDITITQAPAPPQVSLEQEIAALNALNQEREKNKKDDKPLTLKEKKKLEKGRKELWQFVSKKLLSDPVFCNKVKKKKGKGLEDLKEKAEKCAVRIGLKLEKSGFSETRLWLMFKDNEKGIVGFHDELSAAVINGTVETDLDARKPKDRLDAELLKDGTVFKYIGQYIQGNPGGGRMASSNENGGPSTGDLQNILENVNSNSSAPTSPVPPAKEEPESEWDLAIKSFAPFKTYLAQQQVPVEVSDAYGLCLVLSGFTYDTLHSCVTNFEPPEPENPDEPPETVYGHLLNCLREISFEKYPRIITDNIDGHTVSIVRFVLDHCSKPKSPPPPATSRHVSPVPPTEDTCQVPTGGNTTCQLPRKKYVLVSVSVDTIPVENGLAVWQICLHTPGLPDEEDPDFEMLMVPSGVNEMKLQEAGFMFNMEKNVWYHQGTEFGRRKAENEEKSVEKLVSYLEELRSGGRGAGLNNGLVLLFECSEDFGLVRGLLSSHSYDIWSDTVRGVGCIDHFTRQADMTTTFSPPYYKVCVGGDSKWLTTLHTGTTEAGDLRQVKVEAETRAEMVYNILCDVSGSAPTYDSFIRWYCYPSQSITMTTLAGQLELQRQLLPLQNHVDRQMFNNRVQCVLEGVFAPRSELEGLKAFSCVARQAVRRLVSLGFNLDNLKNSFRADPNYEIPANVFLQDMTQVQRLRVHAQTDYVRKFIKEYFSPSYFKF